MKKILFILLAGLLMWSCSKSDDNEDSRTPVGEAFDPPNGTYMEAFIRPDSLILSFIKGNSSYLSRIQTDFSLDNTHRRNCVIYAYASAYKSDVAKYKEYAKYYCDTAYYESHTIGYDCVGCLMPLNSISVVADQDIDESHPTGSSLNDLFKISYSRFYQYIKNGYIPDIRPNAYTLDSISELSTFKGTYLFPEKAALIFKKEPAPGKYTFTVTLDFGEDPLTGKKVTVPPASIEIEF